METVQIEAVYENGTLKLDRELPLQDGQRVTVTVTVTIRQGGAVERLSGIVPWTGTTEELQRFLDDEDEGLWGAS